MTWPNASVTLNILNCVDLELMTKIKSGPVAGPIGNHCSIFSQFKRTQKLLSGGAHPRGLKKSAHKEQLHFISSTVGCKPPGSSYIAHVTYLVAPMRSKIVSPPSFSSLGMNLETERKNLVSSKVFSSRS